MKILDITNEGVGRIVKGINTTHDVKPGETERQAAKFFGSGSPQPLVSKKVRKNSDPNTLYNLGLAEKKQKPMPKSQAQVGMAGVRG